MERDCGRCNWILGRKRRGIRECDIREAIHNENSLRLFQLRVMIDEETRIELKHIRRINISDTVLHRGGVPEVVVEALIEIRGALDRHPFVAIDVLKVLRDRCSQRAMHREARGSTNSEIRG
jgi:transcriptional regulator of met regulon